MKILVTAAFGHQGKFVIPKLAAAGFDVRAARGTPGRDDEVLGLGASEVFVGDLADPAVYAEALDGCEAVYHISPGAHPREYDMGFAMVEAAKKVGVRHVLFLSLLQPFIDIIQHRYKLEHELALVKSGLNFTALRPCDYMLQEAYVAPAMKTGSMPFYSGDAAGSRAHCKHSYIALEDLTDVAVKVLVEGSAHYFATYELAGPDKITPHGMARILSRVMGREIEPVARSPEDLIDALWGSRDPGEDFTHQADIVRSIQAWYARYDFVGNPRTLEWLLGRKATTFEQFATKAFAELSAKDPQRSDTAGSGQQPEQAMAQESGQ
ncbi:SDR family oxidoreductase [Croceicoccus sediminis]|uniref:SDR family oxidoreductase n=1 Tax=Croceicoccus sediminis TaxID=2571150 RepID=UPI0011843725|nr:NmrA family NAD(P)-binding protein [Croceicoccus sediminis]